MVLSRYSGVMPLFRVILIWKDWKKSITSYVFIQLQPKIFLSQSLMSGLAGILRPHGKPSNYSSPHSHYLALLFSFFTKNSIKGDKYRDFNLYKSLMQTPIYALGQVMESNKKDLFSEIFFQGRVPWEVKRTR